MVSIEEIRRVLNSIIKNIRLGNEEQAKKEFIKLLKSELPFNNRLILKTYELGELFIYLTDTEPHYYVEAITDFLKKEKKSYLLRLIRQEIMYNADLYGIKDLVGINIADLKTFPEDGEFLNFRGLIHSEKGQFEESINHFNRALNKQPNNTVYLRNKALSYLDMYDYKTARKLMQRCIAIDPFREELFKADLDYIDDREEEENRRKNFLELEKRIERNARSLRNIKIDFIAMSAIFVALLTVVIRIITFDYKNFQSLGFWDIISYQLAINIPWLIALVVLIILLIVIFFKK